MMLHFLEELHALYPKAGTKSALTKALNQYISDTLTIIQQGKKFGRATSQDTIEVEEWLEKVDSDQFYMDVATSAERYGVIKLDRLGLCGRHSLTVRDMTWLLLEHTQFGSCAILQRNFSCEAIFFPDRKIFAICRSGRLQVDYLVKLLVGLISGYSKVKRYLSETPDFGGLNLLFPSPLHCIFFGHTALYRIQTAGLYLRAQGYTDPRNVWFNASSLFPLTIIGIADSIVSQGFLETDRQPTSWIFKAGHNYRRDQSDLNKALDTVLLASARWDQTSQPDDSLSIWFGLTSGKRALINEDVVATTILNVLHKQYSSIAVLVDGWTSSSLTNFKMEAPALYSEHESELRQIEQLMAKRFSRSRLISMVGLPYEQKVTLALRCSLFFCGSLSSSIVPDRICGLPGIVHVSNAGRAHAQMHIRRRSIMVPAELIDDHDNQSEASDPLSTPYSIKIPEFAKWFERVAKQKLRSSSSGVSD